MTNDEFNKRMEFSVEQQAQSAADIQIMREVHEADVKLLKDQHRSLTDVVNSVLGIVGHLVTAQQKTEAAQQKTEAAQQRTNAKLAELADRLNVFILFVERYIGGNGGRTSPEHP